MPLNILERWRIMRSKKTIINIFISLFFQVYVLLLGFLVPRLLILTYGSSVNGLTSTINQVLNLVNLLQAGLVGASIFEMYKPIVKKDINTEASIYFFSKRHFEKTGNIFFILTLLIIPYIYFSDSGSISLIDITVSVILLGLNSTLVFRKFSVYDIVFSAHEEKYILIIAQLIGRTVYYIFFFICIFCKFYYPIIYIGNLIGTICRLIFLEFIFSHKYSKKYKNASIVPVKIKNTFHLFSNQVLQQVNDSLPVIIVTGMYGLTQASIYSVYLLVVNLLKMCFNTVMNAIAASFGNLYAIGDKNKTSDTFDLISYVIFIAEILFICPTAMLLNCFVALYTKNMESYSYVDDSLCICCLLYTISYVFYYMYDFALNSIGMYKRAFKTTMIISIFSILITVIGTYMQYSYALFGAAFFFVNAGIIRCYIIKSKVEIKIKKTISRTVQIFVLVICFFLIGELLIINTFLDFIISGFLLIGILLIYILCYSFVFEKNNIKKLKVYIINLRKS